ncbi:MAG: DUF4833 domain-containing protein [Sphingobacteriaceae bacterium]|nr:DUF4833 domain-containing protein [Sphingobacteriaceae bacterium]
MKKIIINFLLILIVVISTSFKATDLNNSFPTPGGIDNMLFYVQRTINSNTIVYELNTDKDGIINEKEPIKVYWIKYAKDGKIDPLTYIQRNYAYGVQTKLIDKEKKSFMFEFVSYHKRQFYLLKSTTDNKYHAYGYVNNKLSILNNIFIKIEGGTFWVPNVKSVEVKAKDTINSDFLTEVIKP